MTRAADLRPVGAPATEGPDGAPGPGWSLISDRVMGGVSDGTLRRETVAGRPALRLQGAVRLENGGGFLQMASDLAPGGRLLDASGWDGLAIDLCGPEGRYGLHLRTAGLAHPWQSFRADVEVGPGWRRHILSFTAFRPHRTQIPLDSGQLRRVGVVAIGHAFTADVALAGLWLYRASVSPPEAR